MYRQQLKGSNRPSNHARTAVVNNASRQQNQPQQLMTNPSNGQVGWNKMSTNSQVESWDNDGSWGWGNEATESSHASHSYQQQTLNQQQAMQSQYYGQHQPSQSMYMNNSLSNQNMTASMHGSTLNHNETSVQKQQMTNFHQVDGQNNVSSLNTNNNINGQSTNEDWNWDSKWDEWSTNEAQEANKQNNQQNSTATLNSHNQSNNAQMNLLNSQTNTSNVHNANQYCQYVMGSNQHQNNTPNISNIDSSNQQNVANTLDYSNDVNASLTTKSTEYFHTQPAENLSVPVSSSSIDNQSTVSTPGINATLTTESSNSINAASDYFSQNTMPIQVVSSANQPQVGANQFQGFEMPPTTSTSHNDEWNWDSEWDTSINPANSVNDNVQPEQLVSSQPINQTESNSVMACTNAYIPDYSNKTIYTQATSEIVPTNVEQQAHCSTQINESYHFNNQQNSEFLNHHIAGHYHDHFRTNLPQENEPQNGKNVTTTAENVPTPPDNYAENVATSAVNYAENVPTSAVNYAENVPTSAVNYAENVPTSAVNYAENVPTSAVNYAENVPTSAVNYTENMPTSAVNYADNVPNYTENVVTSAVIYTENVATSASSNIENIVTTAPNYSENLTSYPENLGHQGSNNFGFDPESHLEYPANNLNDPESNMFNPCSTNQDQILGTQQFIPMTIQDSNQANTLANDIKSDPELCNPIVTQHDPESHQIIPTVSQYGCETGQPTTTEHYSMNAYQSNQTESQDKTKSDIIYPLSSPNEPASLGLDADVNQMDRWSDWGEEPTETNVENNVESGEADISTKVDSPINVPKEKEEKEWVDQGWDDNWGDEVPDELDHKPTAESNTISDHFNQLSLETQDPMNTLEFQNQQIKPHNLNETAQSYEYKTDATQNIVKHNTDLMSHAGSFEHNAPETNIQLQKYGMMHRDQTNTENDLFPQKDQDLMLHPHQVEEKMSVVNTMQSNRPSNQMQTPNYTGPYEYPQPIPEQTLHSQPFRPPSNQSINPPQIPRPPSNQSAHSLPTRPSSSISQPTRTPSNQSAGFQADRPPSNQSSHYQPDRPASNQSSHFHMERPPSNQSFISHPARPLSNQSAHSQLARTSSNQSIQSQPARPPSNLSNISQPCRPPSNQSVHSQPGGPTLNEQMVPHPTKINGITQQSNSYPSTSENSNDSVGFLSSNLNFAPLQQLSQEIHVKSGSMNNSDSNMQAPSETYDEGKNPTAIRNISKLDKPPVNNEQINTNNRNNYFSIGFDDEPAANRSSSNTVKDENEDIVFEDSIMSNATNIQGNFLSDYSRSKSDGIYSGQNNDKDTINSIIQPSSTVKSEGSSATAPPLISAGPTGPPPTGAGPAGPPPMGAGPAGPPPTGAGPAGPPPTGAGPAGPPPMGAGPAGPPPMGAGPTGAVSNLRARKGSPFQPPNKRLQPSKPSVIDPVTEVPKNVDIGQSKNVAPPMNTLWSENISNPGIKLVAVSNPSNVEIKPEPLDSPNRYSIADHRQMSESDELIGHQRGDGATNDIDLPNFSRMIPGEPSKTKSSTTITNQNPPQMVPAMPSERVVTGNDDPQPIIAPRIKQEPQEIRSPPDGPDTNNSNDNAPVIPPIRSATIGSEETSAKQYTSMRDHGQDRSDRNRDRDRTRDKDHTRERDRERDRDRDRYRDRSGDSRDYYGDESPRSRSYDRDQDYDRYYEDDRKRRHRDYGHDDDRRYSSHHRRRERAYRDELDRYGDHVKEEREGDYMDTKESKRKDYKDRSKDYYSYEDDPYYGRHDRSQPVSRSSSFNNLENDGNRSITSGRSRSDYYDRAPRESHSRERMNRDGTYPKDRDHGHRDRRDRKDPRDRDRDAYYKGGFHPFMDPYSGDQNAYDPQYMYNMYQQYYGNHPYYRNYFRQYMKMQYRSSSPHPAEFPDDRTSTRSGRSSINDELKKSVSSGELSGPASVVDEGEPLAEQEALPRMTPLHFQKAHINARFTANGQMLFVLPNDPRDGEKMVVQIRNIQKMLSVDPKLAATINQMKMYPGPLTIGETHKDDVLKYCEQKKMEAKSSKNLQDQESVILLWEYLSLLVTQNGKLMGTDIANLLLNSREQKPSPSTSSSALTSEIDEDETPRAVEDVQIPTPISSRDETALAKRFREYVCLGRKKEAVNFAMREGLWGYAMALASKMDNVTHTRVIAAFMNSLPSNDILQTLFNQLSGKRPEICKSYTSERWGDWREHLAIMVSNSSGDVQHDQAAIIALGDTLVGRGQIHAGHFCYLVADAKWGSYSDKTSKLVLIGSSGAQSFQSFATNEAIQCTEIYEYAQSLNSNISVLETFQSYKLIYALRLVECGFPNEALKYCEVISQCVNKNPNIYLPEFVSQVYELALRLKYHDLHYQMGKGEIHDMPDPDWLLALQQNLLNLRYKTMEMSSTQPQLSEEPTLDAQEGSSSLYPSDSYYNQPQSGVNSIQDYSMADVPDSVDQVSQLESLSINSTPYHEGYNSMTTSQNQESYNQQTASQNDYPLSNNAVGMYGYDYNQQTQPASWTDPNTYSSPVNTTSPSSLPFVPQPENIQTIKTEPSDSPAPVSLPSNLNYDPYAAPGMSQPVPPMMNQPQPGWQPSPTPPNNDNTYNSSPPNENTQHSPEEDEMRSMLSNKAKGDNETKKVKDKTNKKPQKAVTFESIKLTKNEKSVDKPRCKSDKDKSEESRSTSEKPPAVSESASTNTSSSPSSDKKNEDTGNNGQDSQNKNSGLFSTVSSFLFRKNKQVQLPDDKNPSIVWDEAKKKWVNKDGDETEDAAPSAPPPVLSKPTGSLRGPKNRRYLNPIGEKDIVKPKSMMPPPLPPMPTASPGPIDAPQPMSGFMVPAPALGGGGLPESTPESEQAKEIKTENAVNNVPMMNTAPGQPMFFNPAQFQNNSSNQQQNAISSRKSGPNRRPFINSNQR